MLEEEVSLVFDEETFLITKNKLRYRYQHQYLPNGLFSIYGSGVDGRYISMKSLN